MTVQPLASLLSLARIIYWASDHTMSVFFKDISLYVVDSMMPGNR